MTRFVKILSQWRRKEGKNLDPYMCEASSSYLKKTCSIYNTYIFLIFFFRFTSLYGGTQCFHTHFSQFTHWTNSKSKLDYSIQRSGYLTSHDVLWQWAFHPILRSGFCVLNFLSTLSNFLSWGETDRKMSKSWEIWKTLILGW